MARKGLPKSIIKKYGISKKAWRVFRGKKSISSNPRPKKARKVRRKMVRKYSRKRRRRSGGMTIPLAPIAGLGAGMANGIRMAMDGNYNGAIVDITANYTGWRADAGIWDPSMLYRGVAPLVAGLLVHKFIGGAPLNLNRILARAKVPFIRI